MTQHAKRPTLLLVAATLALAAAMIAPGATLAATKPLKLARLDQLGVGPAPNLAMARTADGVLHVVYQTSHLDGGVDGLAARSISPAGTVGPQVQALSGWQAGGRD